MFERKILLAAAICALGLGLITGLGGCATVGNVAQRGALPAIVGLEAAVAETYRAGSQKIDAGEISTAEQAQDLFNGAQVLANRVSMARFAYDVTIGGDASPAVQQQVADARAATDAAYRELLDKLAGRFTVNYST